MARGREIQTLLWALALALVIVGIVTWWQQRRSSDSATRSGQDGRPFIHVQLDRGGDGSVVYRLPAGAMVRDLFRAAAIPVPPRLDPAKVLENGRLYRLEGADAYSESWMSGERLVALGISVPLNECGIEDLTAIPGIGQETAARILERRASLGGFDSYRQVAEVPGVGPKTLELLTRYTRL